MTRPQEGMMFGAMSSSNTTLLNHTILTVQGEAQVRPGSPLNPYLPSKVEAQAIPGSPLLNNTHLCTPSEAHLHDIHYVQNVFRTIPGFLPVINPIEIVEITCCTPVVKPATSMHRRSIKLVICQRQ